jgi:putative restriction endonuclease
MPLLSPSEEETIREQAIAWVQRRIAIGEGRFHHSELGAVPLASGARRLKSVQRGIWKPEHMRSALSITTTFTPQGKQRPYDDAEGPDSLLRYKWQGQDPAAADNRALREAMRTGSPLIWFIGISEGWYAAVAPVWLVAEEAKNRQFVVAVDEVQRSLALSGAAPDALRSYTRRVVEQRMHQRFFRERIMRAYESHCAACRLAHPNLLDAAHIIGDKENGGDPVVANGLALCKIHHAAYDQNILGIRPDYVVEIRQDILDERDGPMLQHGLQDLHGQGLLWLPGHRRDRPDRDRLEVRYSAFRQAVA